MSMYTNGDNCRLFTVPRGTTCFYAISLKTDASLLSLELFKGDVKIVKKER